MCTKLYRTLCVNSFLDAGTLPILARAFGLQSDESSVVSFLVAVLGVH